MVNAYLYYNGNALEAVNFYADAFHTESRRCSSLAMYRAIPAFR